MRKSLGAPAWVLGRCQINTIQTGTLSSHLAERQRTEPKHGSNHCSANSRKFPQLAKFALPPSFGETAQATREKNLPLLPRTAGEQSTSSVTEFIAPEGQSKPWGRALDVLLNCIKNGMSPVQMLQSCTILWELAWNSNPQQVPSASTSATRVLGAIKLTLPTDSKGIWDHFLTSFHFIWCQRRGSKVCFPLIPTVQGQMNVHIFF